MAGTINNKYFFLLLNLLNIVFGNCFIFIIAVMQYIININSMKLQKEGADKFNGGKNI